MTLYGLVAVLSCLAVLVQGAWLVLPRWEMFVSRALSIREGYLDMERNRFTAKQKALVETSQQKPEAVESRRRAPIPNDLEAFINEESAQFARDEATENVRQLYVAYGDWNKVRSAVGIGQMETV